jgi:hypothetical protein
MILVLLQLLGVYLAVGLVFGIVYTTVGVDKIDPASKGSSIGFRALLLPGASALWLVLIVKWVRTLHRENAHP